MIPPARYTGQRVVVLGNGPSVDFAQLEALDHCPLPVFAMGCAYQSARVDVLHSCNPPTWDYYFANDPELRAHPADKWTWDRDCATRHGINHIECVWKDGLSTTPGVIHAGHSAGYQAIGLAYQYGATEIVLLGYDLQYPPGYDQATKTPGGKRHWFGEYPKPLQHWPTGNPQGLLDCYATVDPPAYGIRIINCTAGGLLDQFERGDWKKWLN